jgi:hypothetical protein
MLKNRTFAPYFIIRYAMKKNLMRLMTAVTLMFAATSVNAQDIGSILGSVLGGEQGEDALSGLTSIFSKDKQATTNNIIGTWSYSEPAIVFTSDNLLTKVAAKVAANKLENKLQSYLTQYGIKPGALVLTFNEDGTCTETLNGKTMKGKWQVKDSKLVLTLGGIKALQITTQIDGKNMMFVTDATKLLKLFKSVGAKSTNKNIQTVTSLMKNVDGMQAGVSLKKQ